MNKLITTAVTIVAIVGVFWMYWPNLYHEENGEYVLELGRMVGIAMLIGGGSIVAYLIGGLGKGD